MKETIRHLHLSPKKSYVMNTSYYDFITHNITSYVRPQLSLCKSHSTCTHRWMSFNLCCFPHLNAIWLCIYQKFTTNLNGHPAFCFQIQFWYLNTAIILTLFSFESNNIDTLYASISLLLYHMSISREKNIHALVV